MLSNDLSTISVLLLAVSLAFFAIALWISVRAYRYSGAAWQYVQNMNAESQSLAEIARISADLTELHDAYSALLSSHKKLRSRVGMREVRERRKNGADAPTDGDLPDPRVDPEGWKRAMRLRLRSNSPK